MSTLDEYLSLPVSPDLGVSPLDERISLPMSPDVGALPLDERILAAPDHDVRYSPLGDRRLAARAGLALVAANARYWTSVAPLVRVELRRWRRRARAIEDPELRALALEKLRSESFHAEAAAMLATLAPRAHRRDVVRAIVALELLFDYLDGLTERPSTDPLGEGERLFDAYVDAFATGSHSYGALMPIPDEHAQRQDSRWADGGYLQELSGTVSRALERLPASAAIAPVARSCAARGAQAQIRMHAAGRLGAEQLEDWARREVDSLADHEGRPKLGWRELLAGAASSVLAIHALLAAAADPRTTPARAVAIESAYRHTCVLLTLLDGLVDHEHDRQPGATPANSLGYIDLYPDRDELAQTLLDTAETALRQASALPDGSYHAMTVAGTVAYYTTASSARGELATPIVKRLRTQLTPLITPTLALMHVWRRARWLGRRLSLSRGGLS
ncbi:MAG TPA: DUF2600 family protein [Solirubrobacteraceae bacterium]|jgi:tetraprenyl-beta-curcumene synthase|nr:DUF2600 family protein [Solirubrobacteraceae bacterium]